MSVKTKLTAIAAKLRALLGTSDPLSLDGMASALDTQASQVAAGFSAVADMGGTVPVTQLASTLPDAIRSIPVGVMVQTASGSVTTSSKGLATINCGFKPDLVVFHINTYTSSGDLYENVIALPIAESKQNNGAGLNNITWANSSGDLIECWPESITDTGVSCTFYGYDSSWNEGYASNQTYSWTAIKYTA